MSHVPYWVFGVLAALVVLGLIQSRPRTASRGKVLVLPVIMAAVSLSAIFQLFRPNWIVIVGWLVGVAIAVVNRRLIGFSAQATFCASRKVFMIPGSWLPLALLMGLFALRFVVTSSLVRHPELEHDLPFATLASLGLGMFAGAFIARSMLIFSKAYGPSKVVVD